MPCRTAPEDPRICCASRTASGQRVRKRTLAPLSALSDEQVEAMRAVLAGVAMRPVEGFLAVVRACRHGQLQAVRVAVQRLGPEGDWSLRGPAPSAS